MQSIGYMYVLLMRKNSRQCYCALSARVLLLRRTVVLRTFLPLPPLQSIDVVILPVHSVNICQCSVLQDTY